MNTDWLSNFKTLVMRALIGEDLHYYRTKLGEQVKGISEIDSLLTGKMCEQGGLVQRLLEKRIIGSARMRPRHCLTNISNRYLSDIDWPELDNYFSLG